MHKPNSYEEFMAAKMNAEREYAHSDALKIAKRGRKIAKQAISMTLRGRSNAYRKRTPIEAMREAMLDFPSYDWEDDKSESMAANAELRQMGAPIKVEYRQAISAFDRTIPGIIRVETAADLLADNETSTHMPLIGRSNNPANTQDK